MSLTTKTQRFAGLLFLLQLVPYFTGHELILGEVLYQDDLLLSVQSNRHQIGLAVILEILSAFSFIGFSVILYQQFALFSKSLSIFYLGVRFVEFALIIISQIKLTTLMSLASLTTPETYHTTLAMALKSEWVWISLIYMLLFSINACIFYYLLYQSPLLPKFISIWGFIGAVFAFIGPISYLFQIKTGLGMFLYLPIGLNELCIALWLLIKPTKGISSYPR
ncbi:MAG: hypothetical protein CMP48_19465 [Rickettsiales bacterium]|nr:hypothetical protein [Rickettsiales bacterium]